MKNWNIVLGVLLSANCFALARPATAKDDVDFKPGITLMAEVFQPDGSMPQTYQTPRGPAYWSPELPVLKGDRIKLDIFASTGGADITEAIVRVDNQKICDLHGLPWNTTIDTSRMQSGYHFIEVWVQASGNKPQFNTKTMSFLVASNVPSAVAADARLTGSAPIDSGQMKAQDVGSDTPPMPEILIGREPSPNAQVSVRASAPSVQSQLESGQQPIALTAPTIFSIAPVAGSSAVRFIFELVRGSHIVMMSGTPASFQSERIKIQGRTENRPGLSSGPVTLMVWGLDQLDRPSPPVTLQLTIN